MRFSGWSWIVCLAGVSAAWSQVQLPPGGGVMLPPAAYRPPTSAIGLLEDYARTYQTLKSGRMPSTGMGESVLMAQFLLADPRRCVALPGLAALTEFSTSFKRLVGSSGRGAAGASERELVLTSVARYSCPDADTVEGAKPLARVPGYEMMAITKGTFAETIAPRPRTVLPGMSKEQVEAFQKFGDVTQRYRKDPGAAAVPGSIAARIAEIREINKLPPEQRMKAAEELQARYAKEDGTARKARKAEQARMDEIAAPIIDTLSGRPGAAPKPLAFLGLLKPGEAYVDFYKYYVREGDDFGPSHYLAVISDAGGSRLVRLGPSAPIDAAIFGFIHAAQDRKTFESSWKDLQQLIARPLLASLPAGSKMLWLSPDSDLFNVPFASLLLDLHADLSVTVVPSAYDFSRVASVAAEPPTGKALLVGDLVEAPATTSDVQAVALADVTSALDGQKLQVQKLSGRDATHSAVVSGMRDAQYVLFSTHGRWFNGGGGTIDEAFGSAGIQLWNDAVAPDSVLTAADIVTIDLSKSDLVVLLACETAQGQAVSGQGSLGFQSAFMAAGARSLLVALWRVPADASKDLVQNFYSGLFNRHLSRPEALKQAQDTLRNQPRFADPWNWGGWVLVGDPRPVTQ